MKTKTKQNAAIGLLCDELEHREISQKKLAQACNVSEGLISDILSGRRKISTEMALKLEHVLNIRASLLLNLQQRHELKKSRVKLEKEIQKLASLSA